MSTLLGGVATYTVLFTLAVSVTEHVCRPAVRVRALAAHGLVRTPWAVASGSALAEVTLAVALAAGLWTGTRPLSYGSLLICALLFAGYAGYAQLVVSRGRGGPCGCSGLDTPMSGWVVIRAVALSAVALLGLLPRGGASGAELLLTVLAAGTFCTLLWHLPNAMHDPAAPVADVVPDRAAPAPDAADVVPERTTAR